jgi:hypothetical protein
MKLINNKIIITLLALIVLSYTLIGFCQVYRKTDISYKSRKIISDIYYATYKSNKLVEKIHFVKNSTNNKKGAHPATENRSQKDIRKYIFFNNTLSISNNGILILFCLVLFGSLLINKNKCRDILIHRKAPDITYYKNWILKFITPMEKCIQSRSEEYDINPLNVILWGKTRTLDKLIPSAVFFMPK